MRLQTTRSESWGIGDPVAHPLAQVRLGDGQGPRGSLQDLADMRHSPVFSRLGPPRPGPPSAAPYLLGQKYPEHEKPLRCRATPDPGAPRKGPKGPPVLPIFYPDRPRNAWRVGAAPPLKSPPIGGKAWRVGRPIMVHRIAFARESARRRAAGAGPIAGPTGELRPLLRHSALLVERARPRPPLAAAIRSALRRRDLRRLDAARTNPAPLESRPAELPGSTGG